MLFGVASFTFYVKFISDMTQARPLLRFQQAKIDKAVRLDTIFIGDSSLGNSISSAQFDRINGTHSVNLALMGLFGYGGSYNMLRRAIAKHPETQNVIVMQTPGMMGRPVAYDGFVLSASDFSLSDFPLELRWKIAKNFVFQLVDWKSFVIFFDHKKAVERMKIVNDYVAQGRSVAGTPLDPDEIAPVVPDGGLFLKEIVKFCGVKHLNCIYAQGPMRAAQIKASWKNIEAANRAIIASGIRLVVPHPLDLQERQLGDSPDHVAPQYKTWSTAYYSARIGPWLKPVHH